MEIMRIDGPRNELATVFDFYSNEVVSSSDIRKNKT